MSSTVQRASSASSLSRRRFLGGTALATGLFGIVTQRSRAQEISTGAGVDFGSPAAVP